MELTIATILVTFAGVFLICFMKGAFGGGLQTVQSNEDRAVDERPLLGRLCCKSRLQRIWPLGLKLRAALGSAGPDAFYATSTLRGAQSLSGWRARDQRCKPPQVLGDGG